MARPNVQESDAGLLGHGRGLSGDNDVGRVHLAEAAVAAMNAWATHARVARKTRKSVPTAYNLATLVCVAPPIRALLWIREIARH